MRRSLAAVGISALALVAGSLATAPAHAAPKSPTTTTATPPTFSCRASLLRTEGTPGGLLDAEPVVANPTSPTCSSEDAALIDPLNPLVIPNLATVRLLYTQTNAHGASGSEARAGAATADVTLPDGTIVHAEALTSQATAGCKNGQPDLQGSSHVLFLQVGGQTVVDVSDYTPIVIPGVANIYLNQQTKTGDTVTQRALRVESALGTVTVAESIADVHGTCPGGGGGGGGGGGVPQCSDERDNDRDGLIDFPNDPGCSSPQDDDETNGGTPPQCSDGTDNDGDGYIDYPRDPGCTDRNDDDETNSSNPECSDGVDNDRDGKVDFPADTGCTSGSDDDEAAGFMSGGGGYDEVDKKIANEDYVNPGSSLRFGEVFPCDLGTNPGPNLTVSWHRPQLLGQVKLDTLTRAFCRNDPFINPGKPAAEFDTYVGEGTGTWRDATTGTRVPVTLKFISIDRGEPGAPPVTGVDFFEIEVYGAGSVLLAQGVGTLDEGNIQAHTPGGFRERKTAN
jgi:hypothetical protein